MKFLLYPTNSARKSAAKANYNVVNVLKESVGSNVVHQDDATRIFGQQCSPRCGCAVRFEATFEAGGSNQITSMKYDAKKVVCTNHVSSYDGSVSLKPVYTSQNKPIMKECNCKTVHSLASSIVETLPKMTLSQAQNQLEFKGVRASPSFRYSVLKKHDLLRKGGVQSRNKNCFENNILNVNGGHCFDLIEEALNACLRSYVPQPRRTVYSKKTDDQYEHSSPLRDEFEKNVSNSETGLDPLRFVNAAKQRTAKLLKFSSNFPNLQRSPSSGENMPQFHLMSMDETPSDTLRELRSEIAYLKRKENEGNDFIDDWLSYVDDIEEESGGNL